MDLSDHGMAEARNAEKLLRAEGYPVDKALWSAARSV